MLMFFHLFGNYKQLGVEPRVAFICCADRPFLFHLVFKVTNSSSPNISYFGRRHWYGGDVSSSSYPSQHSAPMHRSCERSVLCAPQVVNGDELEKELCPSLPFPVIAVQ